MTYAGYLIPTMIPGLSLLRGGFTVWHDLSGSEIARLPQGLSRAERTGVDRREEGFSAREYAGALLPLAVLDWTLPLGAEHRARLEAVRPAYVTLERTRALIERHRRICRTITTSASRFWYGGQGRLIQAAALARNNAAQSRSAAHTRTEKAQATRLERLYAEACSGAGVTDPQLARLLDTGTRLAGWIRALSRMDTHAERLKEGRERRLQAGSAREQAFRTAQRGSPLMRQLLTMSLMNLKEPAVSDVRGVNLGHCASALANRERVRRIRLGLSLDAGDPEVRALTRARRLRLGRARLEHYYSLSGTWRQFLRHKAALTKALGYVGKDVRSRHVEAVLCGMRSEYPERRFTAVLRGIKRTLPPSPALDLLPPCPRWS